MRIKKRKNNNGFSSLLFIYIFLPVNLLCYAVISDIKKKNICLLVFLLMFYAWTSPKYLLVMMFMALINYMGALWVEHFRNSTDTLYAYEPFSTNALKMINNENDFVDYNIITDVSKWNKTSKYSTFIGGDNAYTEINNQDVTDGSSVLVIKESFGNAMIPFLVENFENVYVVDYRYFNGMITELVDNKGIENVVFVNNIAITSTRDRIDELKKISK